MGEGKFYAACNIAVKFKKSKPAKKSRPHFCTDGFE